MEETTRIGLSGGRKGNFPSLRSPTSGPYLKARNLSLVKLQFQPLDKSSNAQKRGNKLVKNYEKVQWNDNALELAIKVFNNEKSYSKVCIECNIPRSKYKK